MQNYPLTAYRKPYRLGWQAVTSTIYRCDLVKSHKSSVNSLIAVPAPSTAQGRVFGITTMMIQLLNSLVPCTQMSSQSMSRLTCSLHMIELLNSLVPRTQLSSKSVSRFTCSLHIIELLNSLVPHTQLSSKYVQINLFLAHDSLTHRFHAHSWTVKQIMSRLTCSLHIIELLNSLVPYTQLSSITDVPRYIVSICIGLEYVQIHRFHAQSAT